MPFHCHVTLIACLFGKSFSEDSRSLVETRDGSLESASQTLSIRPHLFSECTAPQIPHQSCKATAEITHWSMPGIPHTAQGGASQREKNLQPSGGGTLANNHLSSKTYREKEERRTETVQHHAHLSKTASQHKLLCLS